MLSRVADSIYWMSRYVERAENVARFIDVNLNLTLDLGPDMASQWAPLVYHHRRRAAFCEALTASRTQEQRDPVSDVRRARTPIRSSPACGTARENARTVREMISSAMWEEINKFYLMVSATRRPTRA